MPQQRKEDTASWMGKNKEFLWTLAVALVLLGIGWGSTQLRIETVQAQADENKTTIKSECVRSQAEDIKLKTQIVQMQADIRYLRENSKDVKQALGSTNEKLDWLIRQQIRAGDND